MMKLWSIFRFEFAYQFRRVSAWLYLVVLLAFTVGMDILIRPGDGVVVNNTFHIISITVIGLFIWLVMGGAIAGEAGARDAQTRMHPLTYVAPITKFQYLGGRFIAAVVLNALLVLSLPLGILLSFYALGINEDAFGPFVLLPYLNVYFLIALPNVFIATALQFFFATLSRHVMSSYFASFLLAVIAQVVAISVARLFGNWDLVKLLDPVGVAGIIGNELQTWTAADKNTRLIRLEGMFLWNRIAWVSVGVAALYFTYVRFNLHNPMATKISRFSWNRKAQPTAPAEIPLPSVRAISVPRVYSTFGFSTALRQMLRIASTSFRKIAVNPAGLTVVGGIALISAFSAERILTHLNIPLLPTTQQVLLYLSPTVSNLGSPWAVIPLLIMHFTGQLVWSERDAGLTDIADAAPVSEWVLFGGKFLGIALIIVVWMALITTGGLLMQFVLGAVHIDIALYLKILFGIQLTDYLLFALLALVVHVVVNRKYVGYLLILVLFMFVCFPRSFGVEHNMLIFGADPGWSYTDMRGFGTTLGPWLWFKMYWISWALLLAVLGRLLWIRGREDTFKYRLRLARRRFRDTTVWVASSAAILVLLSGGFVFYNTNVANKYQTGSDLIRLKVAYERRYGRYRDRPNPQLTSTKLRVEIFPENEQVEIDATYTLVNMDSIPLDSVHIGNIKGVPFGDVIFDRPAESVVKDDELSYHIYKLAQPLYPGDSLKLNFTVGRLQKGFLHEGNESLVVESGTYFTNYDLMPAIGYQSRREIKDAMIRKDFDLPKRAVMASLDDPIAREKSIMSRHNTFEAIVGTAIDETAVAPGVLLTSWSEGGRRYFHYKTDGPIGSEYAFLSSKYAVKEIWWKDVAIKIYYHPSHSQNVERLLRSARASLDDFSEQFGPYPYKHMTLVERAGETGGASADASMINYGEQYSLMNPDESETGFDLPYYILAHEIAHQWWGLARLTPADVEGAGLLIEGLAVYSGMLVLEKSYGPGHLQKFVDYLHSSYEMPRSLATASLLQANEPFLYYRKGGLAMYGLSRYIGKEKVNAALRKLLSERESEEIPLPTTLDLYNELRAVTPDSLSYLLNDLFRTNTYWRLKAKQISASPAQAGNWKVTLKIDAEKVVVDSAGNELSVPMNDWLEVGIYEEAESSQRPLYLQMHRIRSGEQTISVTVSGKPNSGGIDPNGLMIDIRRDDNVAHLNED